MKPKSNSVNRFEDYVKQVRERRRKHLNEYPLSFQWWFAPTDETVISEPPSVSLKAILDQNSKRSWLPLSELLFFQQYTWYASMKYHKKIVGFASGLCTQNCKTVDKAIMSITRVDIDPAYRGRSFCQPFLRHIFQNLQKVGFKNIDLLNVGGLPAYLCYWRAAHAMGYNCWSDSYLSSSQLKACTNALASSCKFEHSDPCKMTFTAAKLPQTKSE
jgi:hypothetical protein